MGKEDVLDIVDKNGKIIGQAPRLEVHQKGLLHREVHVWLYTPQGELIWQVRSPTKETFPGKLDASIGGHVDPGMDYLDSAIKEAEEEAGLKIKPKDLKHVTDIQISAFDPSTELTNNTIRRIYVLRYGGRVEDLKIEEGEATGFEAWPVAKLEKLSASEKGRFIPSLLNSECLTVYHRIEKLV